MDDVAGTLVDLLFADDPYPIYHIDNPIRQPWQDMLPILADALEIPSGNSLPLDKWVAFVRDFPANALNKDQNPATVLADFLEHDFQRMSAGGLLLDTTKSLEHSQTLRAVEPRPCAKGYPILEEYWSYCLEVSSSKAESNYI